MSSCKVVIVLLIFGLIKVMSFYKMSYSPKAESCNKNWFKMSSRCLPGKSDLAAKSDLPG